MTSVDPSQREALLDRLAQKYNETSSRRQRWIYWRKRVTWIILIGGAKAIKRAIDVMGSVFGLLFLFPLFLLIALFIKLTDRGPVFYVTNRVGKWGREFPFPKFRSMVPNADQEKEALKEQSEHVHQGTFKMKRDPRITWIGRLLRKTSLDELPQLWCVLLGDMSLVGPRPPLPEEVATYTLAERRRLDVTPGITGMWQVSGRSEIPFDQQLLLDQEYIQNQSFWLDLKILLRTIPAVLMGRGAY